MLRYRTAFTALAAVFVAAAAPHRSLAQADTAAKKTLTGKWLFSVNTDQGTGTPTVTIKQSGDSLSGHYSSQTLGEHDFKGTVKDLKLTFALQLDADGTAVTIAYAGTFDGKDAIKGTVDFGGYGGGTFTAKRQQ